jgi:hypothetical protein
MSKIERHSQLQCQIVGQANSATEYGEDVVPDRITLFKAANIFAEPNVGLGPLCI